MTALHEGKDETVIPFDLSKYNTVEALLEAPEGEHFEFKEAKNNYHFEKLVKYASAIANYGGGMIVLGITDKRPRKVVGSKVFDQPERTRKGLIEKLHINIDFRLFEYEGKRVLAFEIVSRPVGLPVAVDGIPWWRVGDELTEMPEEIRRAIYAEGGHDFSAEICVGATMDDLDEEAIEIFRTKWIERSKNDRLRKISAKQLLRDCEAITDVGVTYAALILFGNHKSLGEYLAQNEIIFEFRMSERPGPALQREEFRVGFFASFDKIWSLINLRNDRQSYHEGFFIFDVPAFNEDVVREALLNAVSHRNYQMAGSVFVKQYQDRLVIDSPGGFPPEISEETILDRQSPRNRRIAEIFAKCGLVERSGQGMNLIYEQSILDAKPLPNFKGTDEFLVRITFGAAILDEGQLRLMKQISEEQYKHFTTDDFVLIHKLYYGEKIPSAMRSRLKALTDIGVVEHIGRGKYVLARSCYDVTGQIGTRTRIVGLDRETNKELLYRHIKESADTGAQFKELQQVLPALSHDQVTVLLRELRAAGRIHVVGKTNAARWFEGRGDED
jgi:ATP-dependent DNA helicase RecG